MAHDVRSPHIFVDGPGHTASGDEVMDNFDAIWAAIDTLVAPGTIRLSGTASPETGWLLCNGAEVSRTTYATLFGKLGTAFGTGDGSTTFNLPDLRGRVPVGPDGAAGRLTANDARGNASGEEKHALANSEMAQFLTNFAGAGFASLTPGAGVDILTNGTAGATGSPHNNMQPYQVVSYFIKT
jgi:microcystin-dependent protein